MPAPQINYYLTPISPWAYLGAARFRHIVDSSKADVTIHVVDYGTIFPQSGGLPLPKRAPQRLAYRMAELRRFRDYLGLPLVLEPANFPSQTRLGAHAIMAAIDLGGSYAGLHASEAVMAGLWAEDNNMDDHEDVQNALNRAQDVIGHSGKAILDHAQNHADTYNEKITADTEKALAENVFGAPSYVVDGEVFWGQDRLDLLAWRLGV